MSSAPSAERELHKGIREKAFERVYYFHGEDDYLKDEAVRALVAAAVEPATRDFNLEMRRGTELGAETVESLVGTSPMFATRRVVVIRDVGALRKDARQVLERYLRSPAGDLVLVLVAAAGTKADKALGAGAGLSLEFAPLTGARVPKWIAHHASTVHGVTITPDAVALLQSAAGSDLQQLVAELDKLASYTRGAEIDESAVAAVVGVQRGETIGALLDAVAERDAARAVPLVPHVLAQPRTTGVSVVMALATQTLALGWASARRERGTPKSALSGELFSLLKETGAFPGRPWGEAVSAWARSADRWNARSVDEVLELLLAADVALKDTRLSSDEQLLSSLVLAICASGTHRAAA